MKNLSYTLLIFLSFLCTPSWGQEIPNLSDLDRETKSSIELACITSYSDGPVAYARCLNGHLSQMETAPKIPFTKSMLQTAFKKLSKDQRIQVQSNLKDSGFYKSSIDGLYGAGTKKALEAYNNEHLGGSDLTKTENAQNLLLGLVNATPPAETFSPKD